jgi:hypothetical protein
MTLRAIAITTGKLVLCGLAYLVGTLLGGILAGISGLPLPEMPAGVSADQTAATLPLAGIILAATLAVLSHRLRLDFLGRWLAVGLLAYVAYALNTFLETFLVMPEVAEAYVPVMNLAACLCVSATVAWLFPSRGEKAPLGTVLREFIARRSPGAWAWRLLAAFAAFPIAYLVFGSLVLPFVGNYYAEQYAGLTAPTWSELLPVLLLRSLLFLVAALPVLAAWRGSRARQFWVLGMALFILVGGIYMMQGFWLPPIMRVAHSLEILADSLVHAAALVFFLVPPRAGEARQVGQAVSLGRP